MKLIAYGKQSINKKDLSYINKSFLADKITTGDYVSLFEKKISNYLNSPGTLVCNSGTAGLHVALETLGLNSSKNIIMPIINFISAYRIAKLLKAKIFFADVDGLTGQMTSKNILDCIKKNKLKKVDFLITMYLGGYPEDINNIIELKKKYKFILVEDACHAFGSQYFYKGKFYKVGSCKHSDASVFSFHPLKTITTGEGGAVSFKSKKNLSIGKKLLSHGIIRMKEHWNYNIMNLGMNYRLSDINCALGITQLNQINNFLKKRKKIYDIYLNFFSKNSRTFKTPNYDKKNKSSYHLFIVHINLKSLKISKKKIFNFFLKNKIFVQQHYLPLYSYNFWKSSKKYPGAKSYISTCFSFPIHCGLSNKDLNYIIRFTKKLI